MAYCTYFKFFADNFLRTGYVSEKKTTEVKGEDLSKYGIIIADHSDIVRWQESLTAGMTENEDAGFDWEFAHFPGFKSADGTVYKNIGVKTLGFAVINRDVVKSSGASNDVDKTDEEIQEEKATKNTKDANNNTDFFIIVILRYIPSSHRF